MSIFACATASGETERTAVSVHPVTLHLTPFETLPNSEMASPVPQTFVLRTYSRVVNTTILCLHMICALSGSGRRSVLCPPLLGRTLSVGHGRSCVLDSLNHCYCREQSYQENTCVELTHESRHYQNEETFWTFLDTDSFHLSPQLFGTRASIANH